VDRALWELTWEMGCSRNQEAGIDHELFVSDGI
jgi:hypothetical protein